MPLALAAVTCAGADTQPARPAPLPQPPPAAPQVPWDTFVKSESWPSSTDAWFIAKGHYGGTFEARVRVSPAALEAYQVHTSGAQFEPGTTLIMLHRSRATGKRGPIHAMQKQAKGWEYLLLDENGAIEQQGQLTQCARCHAEAASDSVFGPPAE